MYVRLKILGGMNLSQSDVLAIMSKDKAKWWSRKELQALLDLGPSSLNTNLNKLLRDGCIIAKFKSIRSSYLYKVKQK